MSNLAAIAASHRLRMGWIIAAGLAAAVLLGLAVSRYGAPVFALFAGPALGLLLFIRPELGVYAITLTLPVEDLIPGIGTATGTRLLGMGVFGIWVLRKIIRRDSWTPVLKPPLMVGTMLFLGWIFASMLWAQDRDAAILGLITQVQLIFLAFIVVDVVRSWDRAIWIARLLVIGGLIAASFTVQQYFVEELKRAGDGISGGINFTASTLVSILPFAFYLIRSRTKSIWTFLGSVYIPLGVIAVTVTFSRTSYILLVFVLAVHVWLLMQTYSRRIWVVLIGCLTVAVFLVAPKEAINERVQSISPLLENWFSTEASENLQADVRAFHWQVGVEMLADSPVLGVGYSNFGERFLIYQYDVQGTPEVFYNPRSPHSSYVGIITELGLAGIGLFIFILGAAFHNLVAAGRQLKADRDNEKLYLVQAVYYTFILQILYGWALNTHMNKNFWLILGMSVVLYQLTRKWRTEP